MTIRPNARDDKWWMKLEANDIRIESAERLERYYQSQPKIYQCERCKFMIPNYYECRKCGAITCQPCIYYAHATGLSPNARKCKVGIITGVRT